MNRKVMFLFVATGLAFIQERMDLLDDLTNDINLFINLFLIYLLSIPLLVISFFSFFISWRRKKYEEQYIALLLCIFSVIVICWRSPFSMSLWVESNSIKEAKRAGTYLCSYRCSKPILGGGLYRLPLQEVFLEKSHAWKTYNENRMWISDKDTDLRVIFNDKKSDDSPFRTRLSWKTCKYKHFKSVDILGREQIKPNDTLQFLVDFYLYRNGDDRLICTDSVLFYPYVE